MNLFNVLIQIYIEEEMYLFGSIVFAKDTGVDVGLYLFSACELSYVFKHI